MAGSEDESNDSELIGDGGDESKGDRDGKAESASDEDDPEAEEEEAYVETRGKGKGKGSKRGRPKGVKTKNDPAGVLQDAPAGKAKGGKAGKGKKGGANGGGRKSLVVDGKKKCKGCSKWREVELFPEGSSSEKSCRQAMQNISYACTNQADVDWWAEVQDNPGKLEAVLAEYFARCPRVEAPGKKRSAFKFVVAQYREEERVEKQLLLDGVSEMMNLIQYQCHKEKRKNGGVSFEISAIDFAEKLRMQKLKGTADTKGEHPVHKD